MEPIMKPEELIKFRTDWGMDGKQFAELIGVTPQAVQLWENGQRRVPETTVRLIKMFIRKPDLMKEF